MKKVLVGMSGGIDSTISAWLLQQQGYELEGLYMKLHPNEEFHNLHLNRAKNACDFLNIPLHVMDMQNQFKSQVIDPFVKTYIDGKTPNPCILCNRDLKFGRMLEFANSIGIKKVATGHYVKTDGEFIYKAKDENKDQSYFLFYINKNILSKLIFPLSDLTKDEIKKIASNTDDLKSFSTQSESSEICFVDTTYTDVLKQYTTVDMPGDVLDKNGNVVGEHKGYMHYTIGKRRGFSVYGAHEPHYVLDLNPDTNEIIVGKKEELACYKVVLNRLNMFIKDVKFQAKIKLRYRTKPIECSVEILKDKAYITLKEAVFGVAVGQAGVFYDGDKLLGGGWIEKSL